jgi:hypothetical protein
MLERAAAASELYRDWSRRVIAWHEGFVEGGVRTNAVAAKIGQAVHDAALLRGARLPFSRVELIARGS